MYAHKSFKITLHFFKLTSYLIRYQWALTQGLVTPPNEFQGIIYQDYVNVPLDDVLDMCVYVSKAYGIALEKVLDMYYPDVTVFYAKEANSKAFENYVSYSQLDEESRSDYVVNYGEPKPFVFQLLTKEVQEQRLKEEDKNGLRSMYKQRKGNLND